jgi:hypothetical protein
MPMLVRRSALAFCFVGGVGLAGCAATGSEGVPADVLPDPTLVQPGGAVTVADDVATVQLYREGDEAALPIVSMNSGEQLVLSFDRVGETVGRPLSVFFYHLDREGRRDLSPVEFLDGFQTGEIRDYRSSLGTRVEYVHYRYDFPNDDISFRISGNYAVRVTELGQEEAVLFERAFFVAEERTEVDLVIGTGTLFGGGGSVLQPVARLSPDPELNGQLFDYSVCFARNGQIGATLCADDASLVSQALYQYELPRRSSFPVDGPLYKADIGELRPGRDVDRVDFSTDPFQVVLALDYARFGSDVDPLLLTGAPVVRSVVQGTRRPSIEADYVDVFFRYVPDDEEELEGPVILSGAFNGWAVDPAYQMRWDEDDRVYTATLLLKQGTYLYRYAVADPEELEIRERERGVGRESLYTALVYFRDVALGTDRLVGTRTIVGQE